MRIRPSTISANKLRRQFRTFENYASQEKFKILSESILNQNETFQDKISDKSIIPKKLSIVSSAKKLEILPPRKKKTKQSIQSESVTRLYNGAIDHALPTSVTYNPPTVEESTLENIDKDQFSKFIKGLKKCSGLENDLLMNYEVSKT